MSAVPFALLLAALPVVAQLFPDQIDCATATCAPLVADGDRAAIVAGTILGGKPAIGCARDRQSGIYVTRLRQDTTQPDWVACLGDGREDVISTMVREASGKLLLAGSTDSRAHLWRFDPELHAVTLSAALRDLGFLVGTLALDQSGDVYVAGLGADGGFVARLAGASLEPLWTEAIPEAAHDAGLDAAGQLTLLIGDGTLLRLNPDDGSIQWSKKVDDTYSRALAVESGGALWVTGETDSVRFVTTPNASQAALGGSPVTRYENGNWFRKPDGLHSSSVFALAVDPQARATVWAGTREGVFRSGDNGRTWESRSQGLPTGDVLAIAFAPGTPTLYAAVSETAKVYKSEDQGQTWSETGWASPSRVLALAVDSQTPSNVYAAGPGVWKSSDGGATWVRILEAFGEVTSLAVDTSNPLRLHAAASLVHQGFPVSVSSAALYRSEDGGLTWSIEPVAAPATQILIDPSDTRRVYAQTGEGILLSDDAGATWRTVAPLALFQSLAVNIEEPGVLYALLASGEVLRSAGGGSNFESFAPGGWTSHARVLTISEGSILQAGGGAGLDIFVRQYTSDGELAYSTYLGGDLDDFGMALAVRPEGGAVIAGGTSSNTSPGVSQTAFWGLVDAGGSLRFRQQPVPAATSGYGTALAPASNGRWLLGGVARGARSTRFVAVVGEEIP